MITMAMTDNQPHCGRSGSAVDRTIAPTYEVPQERVVSIEHPMIVKNFDNGFKSLGGEPQIQHVSHFFSCIGGKY